MKIVVTGLRGIPGIQGGVESHCEALYPRIADAGHEVIVVRRKKFIAEGHAVNIYKGVKIKDIDNVSSKGFEAFIHTFLAVIYAKRVGADIVHIHAIGPALMVPFARLLGMKVVMTHHGPDYDRQKWGRLAKKILKLGERWGVKYANAVIVISNHIKRLVETEYPSQHAVYLIRNGFSLPNVKDECLSYTDHLGLTGKKFILTVGRFVKEKGFDLLVDAYCRLSHHDVTLVIAGDADHEDGYSAFLKEKARKAGVLLTGFVQKDKVAALCKACTLFVLPSFHEGLPISLLEAMSTGADVLVSDIPANLEIGLGNEHYFKVGDVDDMAVNIDRHLDNPSRVTYDMSLYDWDVIARETKAVYDSLLS